MLRSTEIDHQPGPTSLLPLLGRSRLTGTASGAPSQEDKSRHRPPFWVDSERAQAKRTPPPLLLPIPSGLQTLSPSPPEREPEGDRQHPAAGTPTTVPAARMWWSSLLRGTNLGNGGHPMNTTTTFAPPLKKKTLLPSRSHPLGFLGCRRRKWTSSTAWSRCPTQRPSYS